MDETPIRKVPIIEAKERHIYIFNAPECRLGVIIKDGTVHCYVRTGTPTFEAINSSFDGFFEWMGTVADAGE